MRFNDKPTGTFRSDARWHAGQMAVEFTLDVRDDGGTHAVRCRVLRAALDDAARRRGPRAEPQAIKLFERFQRRIHDAVDRKLKAGTFEPDGSITVRAADLNG